MRSNLVKALKPLDAVAIESPSTGIGIPDVNCIGAWLECKWMKTWPKGADKNPVRFHHPLSQEQKVWLWRRNTRGGLAMCVVQVSRQWFFFDGIRIKDLWEQMTRPEMIEEAVMYMPNGLESERLIRYIRENGS
jgi:hypothetical protein